MPSKNWTESQKDAIFARGGSLLVSAAAGSGKTAVLVQRVIEKITDDKCPCDVDKLLIVTFTKAAANEMRERIAARISELITNDPYNVRLQRQQILLTYAHISTIHGFCSELIRENFYKLDISPDFKIADSNEMMLLREEAVQSVLETLYKREDPMFYRLVESFSSGKDDSKLVKMIYSLYDFVRAHPFPKKWLTEKEAMYRCVGPIVETDWAKTILFYAESAVAYCMDLASNTLLLMQQDNTIEKAYKDAFLSDLESLRKLSDAIENRNWDLLSESIKFFCFERLKTVRGYQDDPLKIKVCSNRDQIKGVLKKLTALVFSNEEQCIQEIHDLAPVVSQFFEAVWMFWKKLDELKQKRNLADFGDLEHWMLKLLVTPQDGGFQKTEDAKLLSSKFQEVMVDEYQDTNEAQNIIFRAISNDESNLFIVGDVKQSIYRFRQAMPEIFLRKKEQYCLYDAKKESFPAKVILDKNFRSRKGVTDAVNFVFSQLMSKEVGEMEYGEEEALIPGAPYLDRQESDTSLHILDLSNSDFDDMDVLEARHIANVILEKISKKELVRDGDIERPVTYRDFCILIRSANKHAAVYAKELTMLGIPAWSDTAGSFFGKKEISVMLSLLRVIDNPVQDIPLLSVLISPIFGFSLDEMSMIRREERKIPLYFAVKKKADGGNEQCRDFIARMERYRRIAATIPLSRLMDYLLEDSGYLVMVEAMPDAELRLANIRLLLTYAKEYEQSFYKGLSGFIRFIDQLEQQKADLTPASTVSETANVVRIMSIHRSKGLEFPICIVAGLSRRFHKDRGDVLLHPDLGLGMKLRKNESMVEYTTMPREAVNLEIDRAGMSEELRILYVAMTRAKESLILITSLKNPDKMFEKLSSQLTETAKVPVYLVRAASSFSDWILLCALRHPSGKKLRNFEEDEPFIKVEKREKWDIKIVTVNEKQEDDVADLPKIEAECDQYLLSVLNKRLQYAYPRKELHTIPTKVSASEFPTQKEDFWDDWQASVPAFMTGERISPAAKGIALHLFLQFAEYNLARENPEEQLQSLCKKGFLTKDQANAVDLSKLKIFFASDLINRILSAEQYFREYRFTVDLKASDIERGIEEGSNELVVLQGAIDCIFIEDGQIVIVDYKTDHLKSIEQLQFRYQKQLSLYRYAAQKCLGLPVKECLIYSLSLGQTVPIDFLL